MIWISQWLCPLRHCSIALAWDDQRQDAECIERKGEQVYESGAANRWCGICRGDLHVEHGRSVFRTMEQALPHLLRVQAANLQSRAVIDLVLAAQKNR